MLLRKATIRVTEEQLLSSLWYSDGSGALGIGVGVDDTYFGWRIRAVRLLAPPLGVEIDIDKVVDDRAALFTGTCDCGWQFKDTAIIGYNDDSAPSGIAARHSDHVKQVT